MNIEELESKIKELNEELENLKKELKEEKIKEGKRWRSKYCDYYFYIDDWMGLNEEQEAGSTVDNERYETGNYFQTKEQGEKQIKKLKIYMQLKDLALRLNDGEKIDWNNNNQRKYYICYTYLKVKLDWESCFRNKNIGQIYCLSEDFLNIALKEIGKENLKFLFGVEE